MSLLHTKKDWELEKESILSQAREQLNYIQDLKMKQKQDRLKFEQEKDLLLRELNEKNQLIQTLQHQHQAEIQAMQNNAEKLKTEQERRILGFHAVKPHSPPTSPINTCFMPPDEDQYVKKLEKTVNYLTQKHEHDETRFRHLLLLENADTLMRAEARLDNLVIEHEQNIRDIKETHQLEQRQLKKDHKHNLESLVQDFEKRIETEQQQLKNDHKRELESLAQDFEKKMDVLKKEKQSLSKKYLILKREHHSALKIGQDLVSISEDDRCDRDKNLVDLLKIAYGNVTRLRSCSTVMLDQTSYMPFY